MSATDRTSAGDDLLRWVSEVGAGPWERLRDASAYVCQRHELRQRPWTLASALSTLGHLDIDWTTRSWSIAPPALNLVPGLGLCVVLTGSRPHYVDRRFDQATDDLAVFPFDIPQHPSPAAKFAKCASVADAQRVAEGLGATFVIDPAGTLAPSLRPVDEEPLGEQAPHPPPDELRRFDPKTLRWEWDRGTQPGLYRFDLHGRPVHRRLDDHGSWWSIDLPIGQFLAVHSRSQPVVRWLRGATDLPPCLEVRREMSLPILAERAATISSGMVAREVDGWRRYLNVPRELAQRIADALLQDL